MVATKLPTTSNNKLNQKEPKAIFYQITVK